MPTTIRQPQPTDTAPRLARLGRVRNIGPDASLRDVVRRMDAVEAVGLLYDGAGWDARRIAAEMGGHPRQVRADVARARLRAAGSACQPCSRQLDGLMTFSAEAIDHSLGCVQCDATRRDLRAGKLVLRDRWRADRTPTAAAPVTDAARPRPQGQKIPATVVTPTGTATSAVEHSAEGEQAQVRDRSTAPPSQTPPLPTHTTGNGRGRRLPVPGRRLRTGLVTALAVLTHLPRAVVAAGVGVMAVAGLVWADVDLFASETAGASADDATTVTAAPAISKELTLAATTAPAAGWPDLSGPGSPQDAPTPVMSDPNPPNLTTPAPPEDPSDPTLRTWQELAACESSSNWGINTGNGFYGGLQFTLDSWHLVGGTGYPHKHPALEQIRRAERLLDLQGWVAWPVCARKLGLR